MDTIVSLLLIAGSIAFHVVAFVIGRRAVTRAFPRGERVAWSFVGARLFIGLAAWYLAGSILFLIGFLGRGHEPFVDETTLRVRVAPAGVAARSGFKDGDRIVSVAGEPVASWDQLRGLVAKRGGEVTPIVVERGAETRTLSVTPEGTPAKIGVGPFIEQRPASVGRAIGAGLVQPAKIMGGAFRAFGRIFTGLGRRPSSRAQVRWSTRRRVRRRPASGRHSSSRPRSHRTRCRSSRWALRSTSS